MVVFGTCVVVDVWRFGVILSPPCAGPGDGDEGQSTDASSRGA